MPIDNNNLYGFPRPLTHVFPPPIVSARAPSSSDFQYPIGQVWIDDVSGDNYTLVKVVANSATWNIGGTISGPVATLTGDAGGAIGPVGGTIILAGTTNEIHTSGSGHTITFSVPSTFVAPGSVAATTTLTSAGATTLATTGASVNTFGNSTGTTSVNIIAGTGASGITTTNGVLNLLSGTGAVNISTDAAATTVDIATGGAAKTVVIGSTNTTSAVTIASGTGGVSVGASANAHTTTLGSTNTTSTTVVQAGSGGITMTGNATLTGNLHLAGAGNKVSIHATTAGSDSIGTATLGTGGTVTVSTSAVATASKIFLSYATCTSTLAAALEAPAGSIVNGVSFVINSQDATDTTSTVNYLIIN